MYYAACGVHMICMLNRKMKFSYKLQADILGYPIHATYNYKLRKKTKKT